MVSVDTPDPIPPPRLRAQSGKAGWPQAELDSGQAWISCAIDDSREAGDGTLLPALDRASVEAALAPCRETGLVRVRDAGKINAGFAALVWRLASVAEQWKLPHRILYLDSSAGQVEAAIRAGDTIGESKWTIWVREGSICHSACVFVLAAGDNRLVAGKVGIHRMMRISSKATSRAELNRQLREVYGNAKDYLERNGVAVAVADLMMTAPNRSLRLLTVEELREYGLDGTNAVQDDLERIRQMRTCGDAFVRHKDAFWVAFDRKCKGEGADLDAVNACGLALKQRFGFPDATCPEESLRWPKPMRLACRRPARRSKRSPVRRRTARRKLARRRATKRRATKRRATKRRPARRRPLPQVLVRPLPRQRRMPPRPTRRRRPTLKAECSDGLHAYRTARCLSSLHDNRAGGRMRGKTKGVLLAYLPSALLVLVGFGVAEVLRLAAAAMHEQWPATVATWLSLVALIAAIARGFWVSWRLWRPRGVAAVPPASGGEV